MDDTRVTAAGQQRTGVPAPDVPPDGPTDADIVELLEHCRAGEPDAWRRMIERLTPSVVAVARSLGLGPRDREDVCQSTWVHAVRAVDTIEQPDRLRAWIVTVARRESIKMVDSESRHVPVDDLEPLDTEDRPGADLGPEAAVVARFEGGRVRQALRRLSPHHRALMAMLTAEPAHSYDEIAVRLDIPRGSIGPTRGRILRRLRDLLEQDDPSAAPEEAEPALSRVARPA